MGNDSEGLLLGAPPSAIDRRTSRNSHRVVERLRAPGEDRFAIGDDEEKQREAKTKAHAAKTVVPQAKSKRSEEGRRSRRIRRRPWRHKRSEERQRPRRIRRREPKRGEDQGAYDEDQGAECEVEDQ